MKTFIQFIVRNKVLEEIDANDVATNDVEAIKTSLAIIHSIPYHDIEIGKREECVCEKEVSDTIFVSPTGLMSKATPNAFFKAITGLSPDRDIRHEDLYYEWLDLIFQKDIDNCIIFR